MATTDFPASDLRYPIGRFGWPEQISANELTQSLADLESLPTDLKSAVAGLSDDALNTPYRPGGWTVRQLVHHVADSHLNSYLRCKLALTADSPTILTYDEKQWAELYDARSLPVEVSLANY